ncbi:MAG: hypothetical protein ACT4TC_23500 [Myxococcaceae bacterium]
MSQKIGTKEFVQRVTEQFAQSISAANTDPSGSRFYLTVKEAKTLPLQFQDNFDNYRKAHGNGSVAVDPLRESFQAYAKQAAEKATRDGVIDASLLPRDLQDNLRVILSEQPPPTTPTLETKLSDSVMSWRTEVGDYYGPGDEPLAASDAASLKTFFEAAPRKDAPVPAGSSAVRAERIVGAESNPLIEGSVLVLFDGADQAKEMIYQTEGQTFSFDL